MDSDSEIARLIFAEQGVANPSAELLGSLSPGLLVRKREEIAAEVVAKEEEARARSPEGRRAAAEAAWQAAEARKADAVKARHLLVHEGVMDEEDASTLPDDDALWEAGFEPRPEHLKTQAERDAEALARGPEYERELEVRALADRYNTMDHSERVALAEGTGITLSEVEADLTRRNIEFGSSIDQAKAWGRGDVAGSVGGDADGDGGSEGGGSE